MVQKRGPIDPARAHPTSAVLVGGALRNVYRRQLVIPGLVSVGDCVATTTPTRGRGIAMACMQITALLTLIGQGTDATTVAEPYGAWYDQNIEPWVADHVAVDAGMVTRWQGHDLNLSTPLTSDLIAAAAEADPRIREHAAGYFAMTALPATLSPSEPLARAVYQSGWRSPYAPGPTRDQLVNGIKAAIPAARPQSQRCVTRDCPPNGVSGLTRRQLSAGRLVTDDRDNQGRERDAQGCEEEDVVIDRVGS